jgi:asparagine synthase (glutamine-hydrolysing)
LHPAIRDQLNEVAVVDFLLGGCYEDRGITIDADVARIPPGHLLVVDQQGTRLRRYFDWPEPVEARWSRPDDCVEAFQELLGRAVRDRLRTPKVAVVMSGGVDSPLVAGIARRELERRFPRPELGAFCCVYDRLIPDDERRYAELAARSLSIPIDVQPLDGGRLFDWVGRLAPAEPFGDVAAVGPCLDQVSRLARRFSVALTGYDGDALLEAALRLHWRERLASGRLGTLARDLAWYVGHTRALPPIGVRTWLAGRSRGVGPARRPRWLREELWRRAASRPSARRPVGTRSRESREPTRGSREPSVRSFASPAWALVFDGYDPGCTGRPLEVRHPLVDLRLIRFALALPAVPWCVDKHLLRRCLDVALPAEIRARPKTPLPADPAAALHRRDGLRSSLPEWRSPLLSAFVDVAAVEEALARDNDNRENRDNRDDNDLWPLLRTVALGAWLLGRTSRTLSCLPLAKGA